MVGATGRTGRHVVKLALARGHAVTAIVRRPADLRDWQGAILQRAICDPCSEPALEAVIPGHEAVISCLGQASADNRFLLRDAAMAMLAAFGRVGGARYIVVSQGLLFPSSNVFIRLLRLILRRVTANSRAMEAVVRASGADWTIVRPPRLLDGGAARGYRMMAEAMPPGRHSMQRADLAAFLLDEAANARHVGRIVGVTSD